MPPVAVNWLLKGEFTSPTVVAGHGSEGAVLMVKLQLVAVAPAESVTVMKNLPVPVGVPLTRPELLNVRPDTAPDIE